MNALSEKLELISSSISKIAKEEGSLEHLSDCISVCQQITEKPLWDRNFTEYASQYTLVHLLEPSESMSTSSLTWDELCGFKSPGCCIKFGKYADSKLPATVSSLERERWICPLI